MEQLLEKHRQFLQTVPMEIVRDSIHDIDWKAPMLSIRGPKGVGKSTLMRQYIKSRFASDDPTVLYCSLDSVYFANHTLLDTAKKFYMNGGRHLFLDEVHKYDNWSTELKEIYDLYPQIQLCISSSSLLNLYAGQADLSRRCINYDIQGLSFREYLRFYKQIDIPRFTLEQILSSPNSICEVVKAVCNPLVEFRQFLRYGYYPFYLNYKDSYYMAIEQVVNTIIDVDLVGVGRVDPANCRKIKALMSILCTSEPYQLDISKMSIQSGLMRNTLVDYLNRMSQAGLLTLLYSDLMNVKKMQKPDKIFIENPNLLYALSSSSVRTGTARETFAANQLKYQHQVEFGKHQGDFFVDGSYRFEIGGEDKDYSQIANLSNSYIFADNIDSAIGHKLPLWLLGFLY